MITPRPETDPSPTLENCLGLAVEQGFESLFQEYYTSLCAYSQKYVSSAADAEQCVMDVFIKLWESKSTIVIRTDIRYYLFASVRNRSLDILRRQKVIHTAMTTEGNDLQIDYSTPLDQMYWKQALCGVEKAIDQLPRECKRIFKMSRYDGKKYGEIAKELNLSVKTIETQISKALKVLRGSEAANGLEFLPSNR